MRISIDFDNCLTQKRVQEVAKKLIQLGHEVYILTSRADGIRRISFQDEYGTNEVVFTTAKLIGIKSHRICFTNQKPKWEYLSGSLIHVHIDDDKGEVEAINRVTNVKGFDCNSPKFESDLFEFLQNVKEF